MAAAVVAPLQAAAAVVDGVVAAAVAALLQAVVAVVAATAPLPAVAAVAGAVDMVAVDLAEEKLLGAASSAANTASMRLWTLGKSSPARHKCPPFTCLLTKHLTVIVINNTSGLSIKYDELIG